MVAHDNRRELLRELQQLELQACRVFVDEPHWLPPGDEAALRYALSLARVSVVPLGTLIGSETVEIGRATDNYRRRLYELLREPFETPRISRADLPALMQRVRVLVREERAALLEFLAPRLTPEALDRAVRTRPFALVLGGGGGTGYVFVGAMWELHEAGLTPDIITGTSMGAILGSFRARQRDFPIEKMSRIVRELSWRKVFRLLDTHSRFGVPATLKLYLRAAVGEHFTVDGRVLQLGDMPIPLRIVVGGITDLSQPERYAHLLDGVDVDNPRTLRRRTAEIARALGDLLNRPTKPITLGQDDLTREFDVVDAMGFSAAVPGVIHYDVLRDDPRMHELLSALAQREHVLRFVDGGVADNLPARAAWEAVQGGSLGPRDPFVLALDSFEPRLALGSNLLFYPIMQMAYENSRLGRKLAHHVVSFRHVLSPLAVVPTPDQLNWAIERGRAEFAPHVGLVRKMLEPVDVDEAVLRA
ncbi:MAG: patatin-like phospholipase family protein [Myxococcota bacterium]